MNAINRRGQRVVCVVAVTVIRWGGHIETNPGWPKEGQEFTVDDFLPSWTTDGATPGISLVGVACIHHLLFSRPVGWPIDCFRPVNERKTDISALVPAAKQLEDA